MVNEVTTLVAMIQEKMVGLHGRPFRGRRRWLASAKL